MGQEVVILRCRQCLTFQCHLSKKSNKFFCTICNEKQPIQRIWKSGSPSECRQARQYLQENVSEGADDEDAGHELDRYEDVIHRKMIQEIDPTFNPSSSEEKSDAPLDDEEAEWQKQLENLEDPDDVMADDFLEEVTPSTEATDETPEPSPPEGRDEGFVDDHKVIISAEVKDRIMNGVHTAVESGTVIPSNVVITALPPLSFMNGNFATSMRIDRNVPIDYSTNGHSVNVKDSPSISQVIGDDDTPAAKKGKYSNIESS